MKIFLFYFFLEGNKNYSVGTKNNNNNNNKKKQTKKNRVGRVSGNTGIFLGLNITRNVIGPKGGLKDCNKVDHYPRFCL